MPAALTPFILLPLYSYPSPGAWNPLFTAAAAHPSVTLNIILNPSNGPGLPTTCPDAAFTAALQQIRQYGNVHTLGYVHTADAYDCGDSGGDICPTSRPLGDVLADVAAYVGWEDAGCGGLGVEGIFVDEAPYTADAAYMDYMRTVSSSARERNKTLLFNAGAAIAPGAEELWELADWINVLESSEEGFATVPEVDGGREYRGQATAIVYGYGGGEGELREDVRRVLGRGMAGMSVTDGEGYLEWGANWMEFVGAVDEVVNGGKA